VLACGAPGGEEGGGAAPSVSSPPLRGRLRRSILPVLAMLARCAVCAWLRAGPVSGLAPFTPAARREAGNSVAVSSPIVVLVLGEADGMEGI
jgi:hypothetical protein